MRQTKRYLVALLAMLLAMSVVCSSFASEPIPDVLSTDLNSELSPISELDAAIPETTEENPEAAASPSPSAEPSKPAAQPTKRVIAQYVTILTGIVDYKANLHAADNATSDILGSYADGTSVGVFDKGSVWSYVQVDGKNGYIETRYLDFESATDGLPSLSAELSDAAGTQQNQVQTLQARIAAPVQYATVFTGRLDYKLNLHAEEMSSSTILGSYADGTSVTVYSKGSIWSYVQVDGKMGYMETRHLSFEGTGELARVAASATAYVVPLPYTDSLPLYQSSSTSSTVLGNYKTDTQVTVYSTSNGWSRVEVSGVPGYMQSQYLASTKGTAGAQTGSFTYAYVLPLPYTDSLPLYSSASTSSGILAYEKLDAQVKVFSSNNGWSYVEAGGRVGYMQSQYLAGTKGTSAYTLGYVLPLSGTDTQPLYGSASTSGSVLAYCKTDTQVKVYTTTSGWSYVEANGQFGFMQSQYIASSKGSLVSATYAYVQPLETLTFQPLYQAPDTSSKQLTTLKANTQARVLSTTGSWSQIEASGQTGYVPSKYLASAKSVFGSGSYTLAYVIPPSGSDTVTLYLGQSTTSTQLGSYRAGTQAKVYATTGGWSYIEIGTQAGFMQAQYLSTNNTGTSYTAYVVLPYGRDYLTLYATASTSAAHVGNYIAGTQVRVIYQAGEWSYVEANGLYGFFQSQYLSATQGGGGTGLYYAYVQPPPYTNAVTLYETASTSAKQLGSYTANTMVSVLQQLGTWSYVNANGKLGYMQSAYLSTSGSTQPVTGYAYITLPPYAISAPMYSQPTESSSLVNSFGNGTRVQILSRTGNWYYVQVGNQTGYIQSGYLTNAETPSTGIYYVRTGSAADYLPLYTQASTSSSIINRYPNGTSVLMVQNMGAWALVEIGTTRGYMQTAYLASTGGSNPGGTSTAVVNNPKASSKLNLRANPTTASTSLGRYGNGTQVTILQYGNEWCHVRVGNIIGYMATRYLKFTGSSSGTTPGWIDPGTSTGIGTAVVKNKNTSAKLHLRSEATTASKSLGLYANGTQVTVLQYGKAWCYVMIGNLRGYMATSNLSITNMPGNGSSIIPQKTAVVNATSLLLYSMPDLTSTGIRAYGRGTLVTVLTYGTEWCQVNVGGQQGYFLTRYLTIQ